MWEISINNQCTMGDIFFLFFLFYEIFLYEIQIIYLKYFLSITWWFSIFRKPKACKCALVYMHQLLGHILTERIPPAAVHSSSLESRSIRYKIDIENNMTWSISTKATKYDVCFYKVQVLYTLQTSTSHSQLQSSHSCFTYLPTYLWTLLYSLIKVRPQVVGVVNTACLTYYTGGSKHMQHVAEVSEEDIPTYFLVGCQLGWLGTRLLGWDGSRLPDAEVDTWYSTSVLGWLGTIMASSIHTFYKASAQCPHKLGQIWNILLTHAQLIRVPCTEARLM